MFEIIRSIQGPDFLAIYLVYSLAVIAAFKILYVSMNRKSGRESGRDELDGYSIAVLKSNNSINFLAQTMLFKLWVEKYLEIKTDPKNTTFHKTAQSSNILSEIEKKFLNFFEGSTSFKMLISDKTMLTHLKSFGKDIKSKLIDMGLIKSAKQMGNEKLYRVIAYLVLLFLGVVKLLMGIHYHKSVGFLVLELISMSILFFIVNQVSYLTADGKEYLKARSIDFSWVKNGTKNSTFPSGNNDAVMAAALFGLGSLYAYPEFGVMSRMIPPDGSSGYVSGSSCSTSGCSNSDGSNSDGGSSGCSSSGCGGGGCGGCGGS